MGKLWAPLVFFAALLVAPMASPQTVGLPLQVRTGEVYTIRVEQTQSINEGQSLGAITQIWALHVVDAEDRIWRYTPVSMSFRLPPGPGEAAGAARTDWEPIGEGMSALLRIAADVGLECRVDEYGACVELLNWPLWRDRAENLVLMFDAFARAAPAQLAGAEEAGKKPSAEEETPSEPGPPPMDWARLREPLLRGLARVLDGVDSADAASTVWAIQPMPALQGRTLTRRQSINVVEELNMPLGAPPLRLSGTMQLQRIDRRNNTGTVIRRVTLDAASARASLQSLTQFVATNVIEPTAAIAGEGENAPDADATMGMLNGLLDSVDLRYEETTSGVVDLTTGMVRETATDFTVTVAPHGGAGADTPLVMRGRTLMHITPGAPELPRLPRGE